MLMTKEAYNRCSKIDFNSVKPLPEGADPDSFLPKRIADPDLYEAIENSIGLNVLETDMDMQENDMTSVAELEKEWIDSSAASN